MTVVADTSPVLNLAAIRRLELLGVLSERTIIPPAVARELRDSGFEPAEAQGLVVQQIGNGKAVNRLLRRLDIGESEAIVLAIEQRADFLLIDERRGRRIAAGFGLRVLGLLGLLAAAKRLGVVSDCKSVLDQLISSGFWIGEDLYKKFLHEMDEANC